MSGLWARLARPAFAELPVGVGEHGAFLVGAVPPCVGPHEVEQPARAGDSPALADVAERYPCIERYAEALDRRFAGFRCCHAENRTLARLRDNRKTRYCCHMTSDTAAKIEAFKAKARALSTPDLLTLWEALKADPETSFSLLLWKGAEYSRRVEAGT